MRPDAMSILLIMRVPVPSSGLSPYYTWMSRVFLLLLNSQENDCIPKKEEGALDKDVSTKGRLKQIMTGRLKIKRADVCKTWEIFMIGLL